MSAGTVNELRPLEWGMGVGVAVAVAVGEGKAGERSARAVRETLPTDELE